MAKKNHKTACVIIPTLLYQPELLRKCLISLNNLVSKNVFEVILVGNVTDLYLRQYIKKLPSFHYRFRSIALGRNKGFPAALNAGIKHTRAQYLVPLNDDAEVDSNWLEELIRTQQSSGADMVASTIFLSDRQTIDSQGFTFLWRGRALPIKNPRSPTQSLPDCWLKHPHLLHQNGSNHWQEPFGSDAAGCLYTRQLFEKIGYFRENFFAYLEDIDLTLRARKAGMYCALAPKAFVYHHKHMTSKNMGNLKIRKDVQNWYRIIFHNYQLPVLTRFGGLIILERVRNVSGYLKRNKSNSKNTNYVPATVIAK